MTTEEEKVAAEDKWIAPDKLYHFIFCFLIAVAVAFLCRRSRAALLRRWSVALASVASLSAGAVKEAADYLGFFASAGASPKDAAADLLGVAIAIAFLSLFPLQKRPPPPHLTHPISIV